MTAHTFTLSNGIQIPKLAIGTYQLPNNDAGYQAIRTAIEAGYRHIDSTYGYHNEQLIMQAIKDCGFKREDFFITSKLWNADQGYEEALAAFEKVCRDFGTDYLDLFLIRWPIPIGHEHDYQTLNQQTWAAFEKLYKEQRIRAIGVCNFLVHHLQPLEQAAEIKPLVNQIEFQPFYQQREIVAYCQEHDMLVEAWSPLLREQGEAKEALTTIARTYGISVSQLCSLYCLQKNILPIIHAQSKHALVANVDLFNMNISTEDMQYLDSLNTLTEYTFHPDRNEEWFE